MLCFQLKQDLAKAGRPKKQNPSQEQLPQRARGAGLCSAQKGHQFAPAVQGYQLVVAAHVGFTNEKGLEAMGSNLYRETPASGAPIAGTPGEDGLGTLRQGYLEESTVDAVREVTELIKAQRGYELNAKVITAADQMLAATTQVK